jgi:hypothetical protein
MMEDSEEVQQLRARDLSVYGNPDGPSFELLMDRHRDSGATTNQAYEAIIEDSQITNQEMDKKFGEKPPPR